MLTTLIFTLAVTYPAVFGASVGVTQQVLVDSVEEQTNFIQSSIFGRKDRIVTLQEPVVLPPSYRGWSDVSEEYEGINTFAHLDFTECTKLENSRTFDIGIVGHPFDLGVSYRPGARFGPNGARQGARRLSPGAGWE